MRFYNHFRHDESISDITARDHYEWSYLKWALHQNCWGISTKRKAKMVMRHIILLLTLFVCVCNAHAWDEEDLMRGAADCTGTELRFFLSHPGVNVNTRIAHMSWSGYTPLLIAVYQGCSGNVELLLDAGADPNVRLKGGKSALDIARERGHRVIMVMLSVAINCARMEKEATKYGLVPSREFCKVCRSGSMDLARVAAKENVRGACERHCQRISNELSLKASHKADFTMSCVENCAKEAMAKFK